MSKFAPDSVDIPVGIDTEDFMMRKLMINDLVKDYDAVMTSQDHLQGVFGSDDLWPADLTLEEDLVDLGWHQKEFENRSSFAYTVMSPDESRCLGCVYVDPADKAGYDASVILWVRASELETGLDDKLCLSVKKWISGEWWFTSVAYPGRDMSWQEWGSLPEKRP